VALFTLEGESVDLTNLRGDVRLQRLVWGGENTDLDQVRHDVEWLQPETGSQIWDEDRGFDDDELRIVRRGFLRLHGDRWRRCRYRSGGRCRRCDHFRGFRGFVLLVEELGNGADDFFSAARGLADLRLLVFSEEVECGGLLCLESAR